MSERPVIAPRTRLVACCGRGCPQSGLVTDQPDLRAAYEQMVPRGWLIEADDEKLFAFCPRCFVADEKGKPIARARAAVGPVLEHPGWFGRHSLTSTAAWGPCPTPELAARCPAEDCDFCRSGRSVYIYEIARALLVEKPENEET